jgi:hypothetical protein
MIASAFAKRIIRSQERSRQAWAEVIDKELPLHIKRNHPGGFSGYGTRSTSRESNTTPRGGQAAGMMMPLSCVSDDAGRAVIPAGDSAGDVTRSFQARITNDRNTLRP